ncbi:SH3 domain-containing protein [Candidatus Orientia mediorientalis]|uniref:SH3 domain-containing protein n=1 Tax=Candidatus Orientia mediorientalis TaxID=911112 RepID=UPI00351CEE5B
MFSFIIIIIMIIFSISIAISNNNNQIPRFVSTKANEINMRVGPNVKYPVKWIFTKKDEPLEIIDKFDQWYYVHDINNDFGWIHSSVLSPKRTVVINRETIQNLYKSSNYKSRVIAYIEPKVRCELKKCTVLMCKLRCKNYTGWVNRKILWGVYDYE